MNRRRSFQSLAVGWVLVPVLAHAQWDPSGINVSQGVAKRFDHYPHLAPDGQGGVVAAWETEHDTGPYDQDVAVCRVSFDGNVLWSTIVTSQAGYQRGAAIVGDGAGGAIVVWFDERTTAPGMGIYAQHYDGAGVPQWATDGVLIADSEPILSAPELRIRAVSDGAGGAFVAWNAFGVALNFDVFAQRVLANGSLPWGANGLDVTTNPGNYEFSCDIVADGVGGLFVTWTRSTTWTDIDAQHFDALGTRLWGNNGAHVTDENDVIEQQSPRIAATSGGGAIVIWDEPKPQSTQVYAQRLDGNGSRMWALAGLSVSGVVNAFEGSARLISDGTDGAFVIWKDSRNDPSVSDLFAAHLLGTGATVSENPLTVAGSRVEDASIVSDGTGGSFVTWRLHDTLAGPTVDLAYVQWLDDTCANLLTNGGVRLYDVTEAQMNPQAVLASAGRFVIIWEDYRDQPFFTDCYVRLFEGNTSEGASVLVVPVDLTTGTTPVALTFDSVTGAGETTLVTSTSGPTVPSGFNVAGVYYELTTNATFTGPIEVCVTYDPLLLTGPESDVELLHHDGTAWVNVTTSVDTLANVVCGETSSLSPFVVGTSTVTAIGDGGPSFALHQNVPNPFNPTTTIRFDVPAGGANVDIAIYDAAGRLVRQIANERRDAGTWSVQWNGDDDRGQRVASGVYFYRMRAGSFVDTKKMVLLK